MSDDLQTAKHPFLCPVCNTGVRAGEKYGIVSIPEEAVQVPVCEYCFEVELDFKEIEEYER